MLKEKNSLNLKKTVQLSLCEVDGEIQSNNNRNSNIVAKIQKVTTSQVNWSKIDFSSVPNITFRVMNVIIMFLFRFACVPSSHNNMRSVHQKLSTCTTMHHELSPSTKLMRRRIANQSCLSGRFT